MIKRYTPRSHQGRLRSGRRFRFSRTRASKFRFGELSVGTRARIDAVLIAVISSSITPSNSCRPCRVMAEQVNTAGGFSNHAEMRSAKAAMFACAVTEEKILGFF